MQVGDRMIWRKVVSNYGHVRLIPVTVLKIGKRVTVEVPLKDGGTHKASVRPERLEPVRL